MDFEAFWDAYPLHMSKTLARDRWEKNLKKGIPAEEMIRAAQNYAKTREREDSRFTMHPSTFLYFKAQRWKDYIGGVPKPENIKKKDKYEGFYL